MSNDMLNNMLSNKLIEKKISGERIFSGKIIGVECDVIELPNGETSFREVIRKNGGVCVVALTETDEVLLVDQYRYPYAEVITEIPAGKLEGNEDPIECAKRELSEETGYEAGIIEPLGIFYPTPGIMDEVLYMYLAKELKEGKMHTDPDEFLANSKIGLEDLVQKIIDGEIPDGKTQAAVLKVWAMKKKGEV